MTAAVTGSKMKPTTSGRVPAVVTATYKAVRGYTDRTIEFLKSQASNARDHDRRVPERC
jgi:hypothetical protein